MQLFPNGTITELRFRDEHPAVAYFNRIWRLQTGAAQQSTNDTRAYNTKYVNTETTTMKQIQLIRSEEEKTTRAKKKKLHSPMSQ